MCVKDVMRMCIGYQYVMMMMMMMMMMIGM